MKHKLLIVVVFSLIFSGNFFAQEKTNQSDLSAKRLVGAEFGINSGLLSLEGRIINSPNYSFHVGIGINPAVAIVTGGIPGLSFSLNNRIRLAKNWLLLAQLRSDILAPTMPVLYLQKQRHMQNIVTASYLDLGVVAGMAYSTKRWELLVPSPFVGYTLTEVEGYEDPEVRVLPCLSICTRLQYKF